MKRLLLVLMTVWLLSGTAFMAQAVKNSNAGKLTKTSPSLMGLSGAWWRNPTYASMLNLTPEQQKRMDDVLQDSRLKLIDANARLDKEELVLKPLMDADRVDESQVLSQIDRVAQARAELEKVNARMLLGIRQILMPEQWSSLQNGKLTKGALKSSLKSKVPAK
jgi:Spy/CpxP family protein refolding chaperone